MYDILISIFSFIFILTIPVFLHELGHFIAAKSVGIKVEKFYIGFNLFGLGIKKIYKGTEYGIGLFPLGGYVKVAGIIDESLDNQNAEKSKDLSVDPNCEFRNKNTFQKLWFLSAGVIMNFILTIIIYFSFNIFNGVYEPINEPIVNNAIQKFDIIDKNWEPKVIDGPAYSAGLRPEDKILGLYHHTFQDKKGPIPNLQIPQDTIYYAINSWGALLNRIKEIGPGETIAINYIRSNQYLKYEKKIQKGIHLHKLNTDAKVDSFNNSGSFEGSVLCRIWKNNTLHDSIIDGSMYFNLDKRPAYTELTGYYAEVKDFYPHDYNNITWDQEPLITDTFNIIDPIASTDLFGATGIIGISSYVEHRELGFVESLTGASIVTYQIIKLTASSLKGLVVGEIPISQLSGIVGIGQIAGETAKNTEKPILALIGLMAFISANLGFINILPIPGLDGGHAAISIAEGVRRKEFTAKTKLRIQMIGMSLIFLLFGFTIFNDLFKIFS